MLAASVASIAASGSRVTGAVGFLRFLPSTLRCFFLAASAACSSWISRSGRAFTTIRATEAEGAEGSDGDVVVEVAEAVAGVEVAEVAVVAVVKVEVLAASDAEGADEVDVEAEEVDAEEAVEAADAEEVEGLLSRGGTAFTSSSSSSSAPHSTAETFLTVEVEVLDFVVDAEVLAEVAVFVVLGAERLEVGAGALLVVVELADVLPEATDLRAGEGGETVLFTEEVLEVVVEAELGGLIGAELAAGEGRV